MTEFKPIFTLTNLMSYAIAEIERARGFIEAATLNQEWLKRIENQTLVKEAHHTTHIEGTELTLEQAERLWKGEKIPDTKPDDVQELLNYRSAFEFVSECLDNKDPITEGMIREIHHRLVKRVRGNQAAPGEYRKIQNYIINSKTREVIYTPPLAVDVPVMMSELVKWLNDILHSREIHPVIVSGISQFQLVHIHPFLDGNGRTSRLLSTICLYKTGYDFKRLFTISEYYDKDRANFYKAIQSVRDNNMDMTEWLDYFVTGLKLQMLSIKDKAEKSINLDMLTQSIKLNERQIKAVEYMLNKGKMTIQEYENLYPSVSRRTLQRDLNDLSEKGVSRAEGATNRLVYRLLI